MEELLDNPQSLRLIRALREKGSMNMRVFTFLSEMAPKNAKKLREDMEAWGVITVAEEAVRRVTTDIEIRLTREGEEIAKLLFAVDPILEQAKRRGAAARASEKS